MLTSFTWIPKGAMKAQPLLSTDSAAEARRKLHQRCPGAAAAMQGLSEEEAQDEGSAVRHSKKGGAITKPRERQRMATAADEGEQGMEDLFDAPTTPFATSPDEDEVGDRIFKDTDLVFAVAAADEGEGAEAAAAAGAAASRLELYTYDEPEDNLFIHHDMDLAAFPLCTAWLTDGTTSLMAVGTMLPFIEIWALDVMDSVAPVLLLGGCAKVEDNYHPKRSRTRLLPDSHQDAVLSVAWNHVAQNIFVSGSADHTIKLWDLNQSSSSSSGGVCLGTYREEEKVQSVCFHGEDPNLLLSGGFDAIMRLRDCRHPQESCFRMAMNGEVIEHVEFVPSISAFPATSIPASSSNNNGAPQMQVMASTSKGTWAAFDLRYTAAPLWHLQPHPSEVTFSSSLHVPGLFATGGKDGKISLWDGRSTNAHGGAAPELIVSRDYRTGGVLSVAFHPNSPHMLGACGMRGEPLVYTMTDDLKGRW
eukprot:gene8061-5613_t